MPVWLTYTVLVLCVIAFGVAIVFDRSTSEAQPWWKRQLPFGVQIAALVVAYLTLRPGQGVEAKAAIAQAQQQGHAVMLELYSNW